MTDNSMNLDRAERALFNRAPEKTDGMLDLARSLPRPEWRPLAR